MVATSDQPTQEGLKRKYVVKGREIAEYLGGVFGGKRVIDITTGNELNVKELLERIKNSIYVCYKDKIGEIKYSPYNPPSKRFLIDNSYMFIDNIDIPKSLNPDTLYLIAMRGDLHLHSIAIPKEVYLDDILRLVRDFEPKIGSNLKIENIMIAKCDPSCVNPDELIPMGLVYVDSEGYVDVCWVAPRINANLTPPPIFRRKEEMEIGSYYP